jgi:hypothetical protein
VLLVGVPDIDADSDSVDSVENVVETDGDDVHDGETVVE